MICYYQLKQMLYDVEYNFESRFKIRCPMFKSKD